MNVEEIIKGILIDFCDEEDISEKASLQNDLALDSLAMVTLLIEIEEKFNIELDESDMNPYDLNTVEDVINLVKKYGGNNYEKNC